MYSSRETQEDRESESTLKTDTYKIEIPKKALRKINRKISSIVAPSLNKIDISSKKEIWERALIEAMLISATIEDVEKDHEKEE